MIPLYQYNFTIATATANIVFEPELNKTNIMAYAPSEDSVKLGHVSPV